MSADVSITYRIDGRDEIVHLSDDWLGFALANDGPDLLPEKMVGRPLWDFIVDETTRYPYGEILARVRQGRAVRFPFRCDAPGRMCDGCHREVSAQTAARRLARGNMGLRDRAAAVAARRERVSAENN